MNTNFNIITNLKSAWLNYVIFFVVIFISDDTFNFGTNENTSFLYIKYFSYLFLTIYLLVISDFKSIIRLTISSLVLLLVLFAILSTAIFNIDFSGGYVYHFWLFFLSFLIVNQIKHQEFIDAYLKFIFIISIISLIVFISASISMSFLEIFPVQYNSFGAKMYNMGICIVFGDGSFLRNTSIFREPGVFMIYLNLAILFELFFKLEINKKHLIVYIIAIFTTLSTAAFIALAFIFFAYLLTQNKSKVAVKNKWLIIVFFLISIFVLSTTELFSLIFDKVGKDNISEGSSLARTVSVIANFNIFLDNFIFGVGIKNYPSVFTNYTLMLVGISMDVWNNTNTITTVFGVYGLLLGVLYIYMIFSFAKKTSNSTIVRMLIILVLIMLYSNEDLRYSLMSSTFLMWGLIKKQSVLIY
jgi:hypothetical protein